MSRQLSIVFTFRAVKENINVRMVEGEKKEEVDDSGFYAGETISSCFSRVKQLKFPLSSFLTGLLSRGSGSSGGRDHRHGRHGFKRDESRSSGRRHD